MTLHLLTKDAAGGLYVCRRCPGVWASAMRATETPCVPDGHGKEQIMDRIKQEAMDGSPAQVERTLGDLLNTGTFADTKAVLGVGELPSDVVIALRFQRGPLKEVGINGCAIEDAVDVLIERLDGFQRGPFACPENELAMGHLHLAKEKLMERTRRRQEQGVEGTNQPHVSSGGQS